MELRRWHSLFTVTGVLVLCCLATGAICMYTASKLRAQSIQPPSGTRANHKVPQTRSEWHHMAHNGSQQEDIFKVTIDPDAPLNGNYTCVTPSIPEFCGEFVTYSTPSYINVTEADARAVHLHDSAGNNCPFFFTKQFVCKRAFPECRQDADGKPSVSKLCETDCLKANTADAMCVHYNVAYIMQFCQNQDFSPDENTCMRLGGLPESDPTVTIILVSLGLAFTGLVYFIYRGKHRSREEEIYEMYRTNGAQVQYYVSLNGDDEPTATTPAAPPATRREESSV
eukprot:GFYU01011192.1.p1 GENE.GFYU01011192.1~~GFYU01011192.1.p1  ORF type:complete len:283 (-),score=47.42 GFYU01011192.1:65-913(-)